MLMYGWMKFVEIAPERYDWAVNVMTGGRIEAIKDRIAQGIRPGDRVLDVGAGTGTLAIRCIERGAHVTAIDSSAFMCEKARRNAARMGKSESLKVVQGSVTQISKIFQEDEFDTIVSTMALGEFPREYLDYFFRDCRRILRPGGRLMIADEVLPEHPVARALYRVGTVLFWIPQFLLLRRVLFPIKNLRGIIEDGGFRVDQVDAWAASSFKLFFATQPRLEGGG